MALPHLLFEYAKYQAAQTDLLDLFIPELRLQLANLNNVRQFDDLFYHLESTFDRNNEFAETNCYAHLKIPSVALLGVLLTLSARSSSINWTNSSNLLDGISTTNESMNSGSDAYNNCTYKLPLKDRSIRIFRRYIGIFMDIGPENIKSLLPASLLYENLMKSLRGFIVRQSSSKEVPVTAAMRKSSRLTDLSMPGPNRTDSDEQSRPSTPETDHIEQAPVTTDLNEIISDSEDNGELLNDAMAGELKKFQIYNFSPTKDSPSGRIGKTLFEGMPHLVRPQSTESIEESDTNQPQKSKESRILKVFDDFLITQKLNPSAQPTYSFWNLLQWAFHCADESSKYQRHLFNSSNTSHSSIYHTYKQFIDVVLDLVAINFSYKVARTIKRKRKGSKGDGGDSPGSQSTDVQTPIDAYFSGDEKERKAITKSISTSSDVLLLSLMSQLSPSKRDWYDRVVEYVFTGLNLKSNYTPYPCYERERLLIKHDGLLHVKGYSSEEKFDDNLDSMDLRFKSLSLVYYRALFFANGEDFYHSLTLHDTTAPKLLITQICSKLVEVDYKYLVGFYEASAADNRIAIPELYRDSMMVSITKGLLAEITKLVEIDDWFFALEDENKLETTLALIQNDDIYLSLTEDVTYKTWDDFYGDWLKLNFLAGWMFDFALDNEQERDSKQMRGVAAKAERVDSKKSAHYKAFIKSHCANSSDYNFILSAEDAERLLGAGTEWVSFAEVVLFKRGGSRTRGH